MIQGTIKPCSHPHFLPRGQSGGGGNIWGVVVARGAGGDSVEHVGGDGGVMDIGEDTASTDGLGQGIGEGITSGINKDIRDQERKGLPGDDERAKGLAEEGEAWVL